MEDGRHFAIISQPVVTIWGGPSETKLSGTETLSNIADEGLYGMLLAVTGGSVDGFWPVRTCYGYSGYVKEGGIRFLTEEEAEAWEKERLMVTFAPCLDVVSVPRVSGVRLASLYRGSLVAVVSFETETAGWASVKLADGQTGYVRNQYLVEKKFSQAGLWTGKLPQRFIVDEDAFRREVVWTAKQYLGTQYRWGGRSTAGIDCSGLTSESYLLCGILIYRDAKIVEGFPVHEIPKEEMQPGDLMYFPGHIAMYLGNGAYIHSTGKIGSGGVVINSLNPSDEDYRADLVECMTAAGSLLFTGQLCRLKRRYTMALDGSSSHLTPWCVSVLGAQLAGEQ